ncbi:hypothetical protein D3C72_1781310 [compost metagenome]
MPNASPSARVLPITARQRGSSSSVRTNSPSSLISLNGNWHRRCNDEKPAPKSSMDKRLPIMRRRTRLSRLVAGASSKPLSVSSNVRQLPGVSCNARIPLMVETSSGLANCMACRLKATLSVEPCSRTGRSKVRTWSICVNSNSSSSPKRSSTGMNTAGDRIPRKGWSQRASTSTPQTSPVSRLNLGW